MVFNMVDKNIIIFTGPSLSSTEAKTILDADYRPPVKRGDITLAIHDNPYIIGIIDGVFHQQPAVAPREILTAINKGIIVIGSSSMGALRAAELDEFGMKGIGYVYEQYSKGILESDDDVAVTINPNSFEQLSEPLVNINYNFNMAFKQGIINESELNKLCKTAKSIFYPKRSYDMILSKTNIPKEVKKQLKLFIDTYAINIKQRDALDMLNFIKELI